MKETLCVFLTVAAFVFQSLLSHARRRFSSSQNQCRLTAFWEYDLSSWDIAAGALLVQEAGGKFTDLSNNPFNLTVRKIIASNGLVHDDILKELQGAGVI